MMGSFTTRMKPCEDDEIDIGDEKATPDLLLRAVGEGLEVVPGIDVGAGDLVLLGDLEDAAVLDVGEDDLDGGVEKLGVDGVEEWPGSSCRCRSRERRS